MPRAQAGVLLVGLITGAALSVGSSGEAQHRGPGTGRAETTTLRVRATTSEAVTAIEAQLDRAVDEVSLPRAAWLLGHDAARGYLLPGYGIVFVLTPRVLPGGEDVFLRFGSSGSPMPVRPHRRVVGPEISDEIETLEKRVIVLQHQTEESRRAAEQNMERIVRDVRVRLGMPGPEEAETPSAPVAQATPRRVAPAPPPWKFWFEAGAGRDERTPQAVIADVREALIAVFETPAARVPGLGPNEFVTVAVDFAPPGILGRAAGHERQRTLILRGRAKDIEARARGAIESSELRHRIEVIEY